MLETIFVTVQWPVDEQEAIRVAKRKECQLYTQTIEGELHCKAIQSKLDSDNSNTY